MLTAIIGSALFTILVLILSIVTISKGYGTSIKLTQLRHLNGREIRIEVNPNEREKKRKTSYGKQKNTWMPESKCFLL